MVAAVVSSKEVDDLSKIDEEKCEYQTNFFLAIMFTEMFFFSVLVLVKCQNDVLV